MGKKNLYPTNIIISHTLTHARTLTLSLTHALFSRFANSCGEYEQVSNTSTGKGYKLNREKPYVWSKKSMLNLWKYDNSAFSLSEVFTFYWTFKAKDSNELGL